MPEAEQIDELSRQRRLAQATGDVPETERLTEALDQAFDEQRRAKARSQHGSTEVIQKRARIALELEKLSRI